jgi:hypothetical protein
MDLDSLIGALNALMIFEIASKLQVRPEKGGWNFQMKVSPKKTVGHYLIGSGFG